MLGSLSASIPCVRHPEQSGSNHRFLDTTRRFAAIPSQWFPEGANPTRAHFWTRQLHTANRVPAGPSQKVLISLRPPDGPSPLKSKAGS